MVAVACKPFAEAWLSKSAHMSKDVTTPPRLLAKARDAARRHLSFTRKRRFAQAIAIRGPTNTPTVRQCKSCRRRACPTLSKVTSEWSPAK